MKRTSFYDRQARLRSVTRRLLLLTVIGSAGVAALGASVGAYVTLARHEPDIVAALDMEVMGEPMLLGGCATLGMTLISVLFRLLQLRLGRRSVMRFFHARDLRGTDEPPSIEERRLVNVVEEMAVASSIQAPRVCLLDEDHSINAFALMLRGDEGVVGVTAGALERLERGELQAMVAHEIGHIANGDAAINIRLLALTQGFREMYDTSRALIAFPARAVKGLNVRIDIALFFSLVMTVLLFVFLVIGMFGAGIARIMQAAIARRREYLADASAVQFTRSSRDLIAALEKADACPLGKNRRRTQHAAFMMFVSPYPARSWLFRTHPRVEDRVRAAEAMTPGRLESIQAVS